MDDQCFRSATLARQGPKAIEAFSVAIEMSEKHADQIYELGYMTDNAKEKKTAIKAFQKYLELSPDGTFSAQAKSRLEELQKHEPSN